MFFRKHVHLVRVIVLLFILFILIGALPYENIVLTEGEKVVLGEENNNAKSLTPVSEGYGENWQKNEMRFMKR